jgi:hypothetical protein
LGQPDVVSCSSAVNSEHIVAELNIIANYDQLSENICLAGVSAVENQAVSAGSGNAAVESKPRLHGMFI